MEPELHLFILWERARYKEKEILEDIQCQLKIVECYDIAWNKKNVASNFSRFYGIKLPNHSKKEKECGNGRFLLITVLDEHPHYDFLETSRGHEYINTNIFRLKEKYRSWTNDGHKIHATNSIRETTHDITLLLGKNYQDYLNDSPEKWDGLYRKIDQDLLGCHGWKSLTELFYVLNSTTNYVVLDHECLPCKFNNQERGDINILVEDYCNFMFVLNATKVFNVPHSAHHKNTVGNQEVFWNIRYIGDNYYCREWQKNMLATKTLSNECVYVPHSENYFYSLVYHLLIHEKIITADSISSIQSLFKQLKPNSQIDIKHYSYLSDAYFILLKEFMYRHHYTFTRPNDKSVCYNEPLIGTDEIIQYLEKNYFLSHVEPIRINHYSSTDHIYFQGYINGQRLLIKWGDDTCKNEFTYTKRFYETSPSHFIKPWFYKCDGNKKFIAMDYVDGISLETLMTRKSLTPEEKDKIILQLNEIARLLLKHKYIHRNIHPANFILTADKQLKLINNQFTVDFMKYKECGAVKRNPAIIIESNGEYAFQKYQWDDFHSLVQIIEHIGVSNKTKNILNEIKSQRGKLKIIFPKRYLFIYAANQLLGGLKRNR